MSHSTKPKTTEQEFGIFCRKVCARCNPVEREVDTRQMLGGCPAIRGIAYFGLKSEYTFGQIAKHLPDEIEAIITQDLIMATANTNKGGS